MSLTTIDFDLLQLAENDRILDMGCGEGRHAITAYMLGNVESVGVDLNIGDLNTTAERFREFAEENCTKSLTLAVADGAHLPFANDHFDKVICSEVLEHIPDYIPVLQELVRVLKAGGILAVSVPRFFPEWVCWQLSDAYHQVPGGHVRIFKAARLRRDIEGQGLIFFRRHWAHALHVPYWWLKCAFWHPEKDVPAVKAYHRFLVWDLMQHPPLTQGLEAMLNPLLGKSVVMYFVKRAATSAAEQRGSL